MYNVVQLCVHLLCTHNNMDNVWAQIKGTINCFNIIFSAVTFLNKIIPNTFQHFRQIVQNLLGGAHDLLRKAVVHTWLLLSFEQNIYLGFIYRQKPLPRDHFLEGKTSKSRIAAHTVHVQQFPTRLFVEGSVGPQQNRGLTLYIG